MTSRQSKLFISTIHWAPFLLALGLVVWQLVPVDGRLGHDYYHFFTRLMIGSVYFWQNGFAVPQYTPSLCGGIPFFADPQSMYYSVPQFLAFFIDPVWATALTVLLFYALGYVGFFRLLTAVFEVPTRLAHIGALLFILNGFSFAHLLVGHVTHHSYLLLPWLLFFFIRCGEKAGVWYDSILFSLIVIYTFYSGGLHVLIIFLWALLLALPYWLYRRCKGEKKTAIIFFLLSTCLIALACSGKLVASILLARNFVHQNIDSSGLGPFQLAYQFFWFNPSTTPDVLKFGRWHFGPWEYVGFLSKVLLPAAVVFLAASALRLTRAKILMIGATLGIGVFFIVVASGGKLNQWLPFFRGYHNPIKILGAGVPFIILAGVLGLRCLSQWLPFRFSTTGTLLVFFISSVIFMTEYRINSKFFLTNALVYGFRYDPKAYEVLKQHGKLVPVTQVTQQYGADFIGLFKGCTSLRCYEPMFGYRRETLRATLFEGSTARVVEGRFNITHPGCLIYPKFFGCKPWDPITAQDKINYFLFVTGKTPKWGLPLWQQILYSIGFSTIGFMVAICLLKPLAEALRSPLPERMPA